MPHIPDSLHPAHDLELIAAFAAGDAAGPDLDAATALVAACTDCAALHHDLRAIATALPALPAPVRTRDFRITPEQAAALRPRGIRGLLAGFASPRFSFAAPLGTGLAAMGIVGVLVASGGMPAGGGTGDPAALRYEQMEPASQPAASSDGTANAPAVLASPAPEGAGSGAGGAGEPGEQPGDLGHAGAPTAAPDGGGTLAADGSAAEAGRAADQTLIIVGGALAIVGMAIVALRWASRRFV